jgi:hypothetical protein
MRIAVLQWATPDYQLEFAPFLARNRAYAASHNYSYILDGAPHHEAAPDLPPHWGKVAALSALLDAREKHDYVLWLDADCLVADGGRRVEDALEQAADAAARAQRRRRARGGAAAGDRAEAPPRVEFVGTDAQLDARFHLNSGAFVIARASGRG